MKEKLNMVMAVSLAGENYYKLEIAFEKMYEDYSWHDVFLYETFEKLIKELDEWFKLEEDELFSLLFSNVDYELGTFNFYVHKDLSDEEHFELYKIL